jgi:hypothetical protein
VRRLLISPNVKQAKWAAYVLKTPPANFLDHKHSAIYGPGEKYWIIGNGTGKPECLLLRNLLLFNGGIWLITVFSCNKEFNKTAKNRHACLLSSLNKRDFPYIP